MVGWVGRWQCALNRFGACKGGSTPALMRCECRFSSRCRRGFTELVLGVPGRIRAEGCARAWLSRRCAAWHCFFDDHVVSGLVVLVSVQEAPSRITGPCLCSRVLLMLDPSPGP